MVDITERYLILRQYLETLNEAVRLGDKAKIAVEARMCRALLAQILSAVEG